MVIIDGEVEAKCKEGKPVRLSDRFDTSIAKEESGSFIPIASHCHFQYEMGGLQALTPYGYCNCNGDDRSYDFEIGSTFGLSLNSPD